MITSNKSNLVRAGYLDVKVPPGNRERKLWKAWQKRWLISRTVEEPFGLELRIYGCQKTSNGQPLCTVFVSPECGRLYRSRSRTHAWVFSIANATVVVLHLAGESEQLSQSWMATIRDALWPPSPLVQLEAAFQDVHRVSLIDDENTCYSDLLAAYGHLYVAGDVILLMSTHSGRLIKKWHLSEVLNMELVRLDDDGKESGVFSLTFQKGSLQYGEKLNFYSQTATSVVQHMSAALKARQEGKASGSSTLKYDSGIEELSELLSFGSEGCDSVKSCDPEGWSSKGVSEGLSYLATMSGDFLNCSINSVFMHQNFSGESRTNSDASSDYSPPLSPTDPTSPNQDRVISPEKVRTTSQCSLDDYYYKENTNIRRNSLEISDSDYTLILQHRPSTFSGIYADISSLPPSKRPSLAETLYEDIDDEEEGFIKLMDGIMEDDYLPPLPPPRNTDDAALSDHPVKRFTNTAKRPSTLGLENLSSSIAETLSQIQNHCEPSCKTAKKSFPAGLFKPIQEVKKILGNKKNSKSPLSSPSNENCKSSVLPNQNHPPNENKIESLLTVHDKNSSNTEYNRYSYNEIVSSSVKNSPVHISHGHFVPFPELSVSTMSCRNESHEDQNEEKPNEMVLSPETQPVVLREGQRGKQARSHDSLLVESLKSKYTCHRQFLEFLHVDENDVHHDTVPHECQQKCFPRSISLEQLPCKSFHCRRHSIGNYNTFPNIRIGNFRNDTVYPALIDLNTASIEKPVLEGVLSRRRSSDYCVMSSLVSPNSEQESDVYITMHDNGKKVGKDSDDTESSDNHQIQRTESESLYIDMTQTAKQILATH